MDGVVEGCKRLIDAGYVLAIASNQGGVEAGHKTLHEATQEMWECMKLLHLEGIEIPLDRVIFCPDFSGLKACLGNGISTDLRESPYPRDLRIGKYRKPGAGMLLLAASEIVTDGWMIGDRDEDRLAAEAAGFSFLDAEEWRKGASPWII
jgi:D-glycero-D-manno-heptose 1,7-bisphosphate phosphatase